ncbi:hypothetical protein [Fibrobacter sp. UWH1]|uniref:hypothetical protein n=1 Tax=Fibrobacter sp. UWH1 TaxID=1964354 RepID=UPI000B52409E|nr:hypothetical protein [Fibrobacter sp. UWH1]OWV15553.1 hypothetical protein B7992_03995 [Fibrobacter sp. UWH1]
MGFLRGLARAIICTTVPGARVAIVAKNVVEEGSVGSGLKRTVKESIEDNPITGTIYNAGKKEGHVNGKKEGYKEASVEYAQKLHNQAKMFLEQKEAMEKDLEGLKKLIIEYSCLIKSLEEKANRTEKENEALIKLNSELEALLNIQNAA